VVVHWYVPAIADKLSHISTTPCQPQEDANSYISRFTFHGYGESDDLKQPISRNMLL